MFRGRRQAVVHFTAIALIAMVACILPAQKAHATAGINQELSFEGKIVSSTGTNITDGNYNAEFVIYTGCTNEPASNAGCTAVWTEDYLTSNTTYASTVPVTFTSGTFQVNLGAVCSFAGGSCEGNTNTAINWDTYPLYVSINVGTTSVCAAGFASCGGGTGAMNPYILLTASPYAMNAQNANQLGGLAASQFGQLASNQTWTGTNTFQPSTNITSMIIAQNSSGSFGQDVFDVQGSSGGANNFIQVTSTAANAGAVTVQALGANTLSLLAGSGGTINIATSNDNSVTVGSTTATSAIKVGQSTASNTVSIGDGATTTGNTQTINIGSGATTGSGGSDAVTIGSTANASSLSLQAGTGNVTLTAPTVQVGSNSTSNTTDAFLQLNSDSNYSESATCSTSTNQGAVYYNTSTNAIRGCVNGGWEDLATTSGLGILLFGVVPDSGSVPGDLESTSSAGVSGPCKVSWASATSVTVQACSVYTGGRKIVQPQVTVTLPAMAKSAFTHLCYWNSTSNAAAGPITNATTFFTTSNATESASLPTFSANNPVVCLATIKNSQTATNTIGQIFDTRVFNNSQKTFMNGTVALSPGWAVITTTTNTTQVTTTSTAATKGLAGVVAAGSSSAWASGGPNAIIATAGPVEVEATAGATSAYNYIETTTTAGYVTTVTTASTTLTLPALYLGLANTAFGSCSTPSASTCQGSLLTNIQLMY